MFVETPQRSGQILVPTFEAELTQGGHSGAFDGNRHREIAIEWREEGDFDDGKVRNLKRGLSIRSALDGSRIVGVDWGWWRSKALLPLQDERSTAVDCIFGGRSPWELLLATLLRFGASRRSKSDG